MVKRSDSVNRPLQDNARLAAAGPIDTPRSDKAENSEQRINEGRHRRALRKNDEPTQQHHDDDDGSQPELLLFAHECPQVFYQIYHQKGLSMWVLGRLVLGTR